MNALTHTTIQNKLPVLEKIARRVVWFSAPEETLKDISYFLTYAMQYGTAADIKILWPIFKKAGFKEALANAPRGVLDARSLHFWTLKTH